jgi:hypothetical protein
LELCVWPDAISPKILTADQKQQRVNICKELCQIASDDAAFLSRVITDDESWIYGYDPETKQQSSQWKSPNSLRPKKARQVKSKARACSSVSLTLRGLFTKNSSWQAKQSVLHTIVTFYGDCMKMYKGFAPNFGDQGTGCCITTTHLLTLPFSPRNFFTKNNMTVVPHPP